VVVEIAVVLSLIVGVMVRLVRAFAGTAKTNRLNPKEKRASQEVRLEFITRTYT